MEKHMMERAEVVKAMETMARCINAENIFYSWLSVGVADGDIKQDTTLQDIIDYGYCEDAEFKDLMTLFLKLMYRASKDGGLYTDGIVSGGMKIVWEQEV